MSIGRSCLDCKHLSLDGGWIGTDVTPGTPMTWQCMKGRYDLDTSDLSRERVKSVLDLADGCPEFTQAERGDP